MTPIAFYRLESGEIIQTTFLPPGMSLSDYPPPDGTAGIETEFEVDGDTYWVEPQTLEVRPYSEQGRLHKKEQVNKTGYRWVPSLESWVDERTVEEVQKHLLVLLKQKRDRLIEAGFVWDGSVFDSDVAVSQPRLLGLFTTASSGMFPPEGYQWRLADNSWRTLSAQDAVEVWRALQNHVAVTFQSFAAHENRIMATTDLNALRNYNIHADWKK